MTRIMPCLLVAAAWAAAAEAPAQEPVRSIRLGSVEEILGPGRHIERIGREVARALALDDEDETAAHLARASEEARELARAYPDHADAHYLVAASLGSLMDHQGVRAKIQSANEVRSAAEAALALDPDHAGAHHVLGRLHAGGMRAPRVLRILARAFFGAEVFDGISWARAEEHFLRALALEPDSPRHAMELGALYMDTGRPDEAGRLLRQAVASSRRAPGDELAVEHARHLLQSVAGTWVGARTPSPEAGGE